MKSDLSKLNGQLETMKNEVSCLRMGSAKLKTWNAVLREVFQNPTVLVSTCQFLQQAVTQILFDRADERQSTGKDDEFLMNIGFVLLSYSSTDDVPFPCRNTIYSQVIPKIPIREQLLTNFEKFQKFTRIKEILIIFGWHLTQ
jgi:hypothetical protein